MVVNACQACSGGAWADWLEREAYDRIASCAGAAWVARCRLRFPRFWGDRSPHARPHRTSHGLATGGSV